MYYGESMVMHSVIVKEFLTLKDDRFSDLCKSRREALVKDKSKWFIPDDVAPRGLDNDPEHRIGLVKTYVDVINRGLTGALTSHKYMMDAMDAMQTAAANFGASLKKVLRLLLFTTS